MATLTKGRITSYARPTSIIQRPIPVAPTPPFPALRAPPDFKKPEPPYRPHVDSIEGWERTDHVLHAAYPRTFLESTGDLYRESEPYGVEGENETKEQRLERVENSVKVAVDMRRRAKRVGAGDDTPGLYIAAERWKREGGSDEGLVLVITHANGFNKEVSRRDMQFEIGVI